MAIDLAETVGDVRFIACNLFPYGAVFVVISLKEHGIGCVRINTLCGVGSCSLKFSGVAPTHSEASSA